MPRWLIASFFLALGVPSMLFAQPPIPVTGHSQLGRIDFPNSGSPEAQEPFIRGVLLLHSFEYEDAREAFQEAQRLDPGFALAFWGEAMTHNHPLWAQQNRDAARAALARFASTKEARLARASTDRERGFLEAVEILYGEGDKQTRDLAYSQAMARLAARYPEDLEARSFYALSILGTVGARDFRTYMRAGAVAEEVYAQNPRHPGAAHYLIHSYDDPVHAPLGLRAARAYAQIAPAASHAQHMISHIYTALGQWDEVIEANQKAVAVSEDRLRRKGRPLHQRSHHALLWLEYGYLQQGRFEEARETLATMAADATASPDLGNLWHYAQMRAAYIVADPGRTDATPPMELKGVALGAVAADGFATGLQALSREDLAAAREAAERLRVASEAARSTTTDQGRNAYDGANDKSEFVVARILEQELEALILFAEGKTAEAVALLEEATAAEEMRPLEYGPPSVVKPSHELLGEMLLALNRTAEARLQFLEALERAPRRTLSIVGLATAAERAGDPETALEARKTLDEIWKNDDVELIAGGMLTPVVH
jgi:tetratricopeptide (TPR) repeat protein